MRGSDERTGELFSYVDIEERVPQNHPLRLIRRIVNEVLAALDGEFAKPARPAMPATRQASRNASASKSRSAGARRSADWHGPCCAAAAYDLIKLPRLIGAAA